MLAGPRLIEGRFPCREVGAETQRERGASSSLPPLYFLHVWSGLHLASHTEKNSK